MKFFKGVCIDNLIFIITFSIQLLCMNFKTKIFYVHHLGNYKSCNFTAKYQEFCYICDKFYTVSFTSASG